MAKYRCRTEMSARSSDFRIRCGQRRVSPRRTAAMFHVAERALGSPLAKTNDTMESANPPLRRQFRLTRTDGDEGPNSVDRGFRNNSELSAFRLHYSSADYIENACYGIHA